MATFTIQDDLTTRAHLADLAKVIKRKFVATAYQGQYVNEYTTKTFGDRVQVGTTRTIGGALYLFVLNVQILRNSGGRVGIRVAAFSLNNDEVTGTWSVGRTAIGGDKKAKANGVFLTGKGWHRHLSGKNVPTNVEGIATRIYPFMEQAVERIEASLKSDAVGPGRPVQLTHGYSPSNPLFGETYETDEEHLLVFGGIAGAYHKLTK